MTANNVNTMTANNVNTMTANNVSSDWIYSNSSNVQ
jgi:hypothetical protein